MATVPSIGRAHVSRPLRLVPDAADATSDLYARYSAQIYRFCLRELGNREEAEDAAQTTFLNAFRGLDRGVAPEFETAWIYTIAHRVCVSRKRSSFRRGRLESADDLDVIQEVVPSRTPDVDELFGLRSALEALPEQQRRALLLREWQGLSCKEIAGELDLSPAAVEMLLFRARRGMVEELTAETPRERRGVRGRLRTSGDMGSLIAAAKTLFFTGGTKLVATLATVAASSVVAATPATRNEIASLVTMPAHHIAPKAKPTTVAALPVTTTPSGPRSQANGTPLHVVRTGAHAQRAHTLRAVRFDTVPVAATGRRAAQVGPAPTVHSSPSAVSPQAPVSEPTAAPPAQADPSAATDAAPAPDPAPAPSTTPADQVAPVQAPPSAPPKAQKPPVVASPVTPVPIVVAPAVGAVSPVVGKPGTSVTITGAHLAGATSVTFNGVSARFGGDNDSRLHAKVPDGATTGPITVTTPGGTASSVTFTVASSQAQPPAAPPPALPSLGDLSPATGAPGTWVTIEGSRLSGTSAVQFNGVAATFTIDSDSEIHARVPDGATSGPLTVTTASGSATSGGTFTVVAPVPTLTSLSPASGLAGATVTINGAYLSGATAVSFNGVPATFTAVSDAQLTAQVPAAATTGSIRVTTPAGTTTSADSFTVPALGPPTLTGFSGTSGRFGSWVAISGTHLSGVTSVTFNGVPARFTNVSDAQLYAQVPPSATSGPIVVTTPAGSATSAAAFAVIQGGGGGIVSR